MIETDEGFLYRHHAEAAQIPQAEHIDLDTHLLSRYELAHVELVRLLVKFVV